MGLRDADKVAARGAARARTDSGFPAAQSRRHGVWLVGGTLPLDAPEPDRVLNSSLVFDPQGQRVARYDKVHLFRFTRGTESYDEAQTIAPGREVAHFELAAGGPTLKIGLSICYDLRFPELYRSMGQPDLILVPSAFTATTGRAHWETLAARPRDREPVLRTRAGPGWAPRERARDLRALDADRPMGRCHCQSPRRPGGCLRRH
jgi:nitrilase